MRSPNSTEKCRTLWDSTLTAACGFANAVRHEKKVRQVVFAMGGAIAIAVVAKMGYFQTCLLIFAWVVALICELFNTALEKALDYSGGKEIHPLIRQGKDYASSCTFISVLFAMGLTFFLLLKR